MNDPGDNKNVENLPQKVVDSCGNIDESIKVSDTKTSLSNGDSSSGNTLATALSPSDNSNLVDNSVNNNVSNENSSTTIDAVVNNKILVNPESVNILSPKKTRRVFFPHDDNVVAGYLEPTNPWNNGK